MFIIHKRCCVGFTSVAFLLVLPIDIKSLSQQVYKKAVLSQGEPRDAAVNFNTCQILQPYRAVSLPQHGFLVGLRLQTADNAGLLSRVSEEVDTEISKNALVDKPIAV